MNVKIRILAGILRIGNDNRKARRIAKKALRDEAEEKYPEQWRNKWVLKRSKRMAKRLKLVLEIEGYDNLPRGAFIITPNHSSSFDPALIQMALEQKDPSIDKENIIPCFLAKDDIKKKRKIRGWADMLNTFYLSRENPRSALDTLDEFTEYIKEHKRAGVIFPEGTRSKDGQIKEFKAGAFHSAKKAFLQIVPCTINNALSITDLSRKNILKVKVIFHQPIKPFSFITSEKKAIASRIERIVKSRWVKPEGTRSIKENKIA